MKRVQLLGNVDNFYEIDDKFWNTALSSWLDMTGLYRNLYIYTLYAKMIHEKNHDYSCIMIIYTA